MATMGFGDWSNTGPITDEWFRLKAAGYNPKLALTGGWDNGTWYIIPGAQSSVASVNATPVTPTFDPKIEANALYGKPMALSAMGYARIGGSPAPIVGPYMSATTVDFIVSFGVPANVEGDRKIFKIYLDNELVWSSAAGGTLPGHGIFAAEPFDFVFKPGRLDQTVCSLETEKFPGDECAYRPQMILEIRNLIFARFMEMTGKPVPYVALEIGDVSDGADPEDGINLGLALSRCAWSPWANYTPSTFEAVNITDVVDAILIKDNFTIVELCQSVTREYRNIDLLLSDKMAIKDRGSSVAPNFIFNRSTIISDDGAVVVSRAGATEQRREHELVAIDPDQDYTAVPSLAKIPRDPMVISAAVGKETASIPLVIDANTRQALATFAQNYEENARRKVAFKVSAASYGIEPGDLFALTDIAEGFDNEVFKCTQTTHGANWVVEVEGEAILRCSIYGGYGGIDAATWDPATATNVTISGGVSGSNLVATNTETNSANQGVRVAAASGKTSGKYYFELTYTNLVTGGGLNRGFGIGTTGSNYTEMGDSATVGCISFAGLGTIWANGSNTEISTGGAAEYETIGCAVDLDNRRIWFRRMTGFWNSNAANDPATNVGGVAVPAGTMVPFCVFGGIIGLPGNVYTVNFGATAFSGAVPSGFTPGWPV